MKPALLPVEECMAKATTEHAEHLAGMVTPKDIPNYWRIRKDNADYLQVELERFAANHAGARIRELEAENQWLPLEMAPVGQTVLIAWKDGIGIGVARTKDGMRAKATHFRPLPAPPPPANDNEPVKAEAA